MNFIKHITVNSLWLFPLVFISANAQNTTQSKVAEDLATSKLSPACQEKVIRIVDDIIGPKTHRILAKNVSQTDTFHAFILLSYNDQDSHLSITVTPNNTDCQVNTNESFELPAPCPDARNSIFKRWAILGRMDENTLVMRYDHPRNKAELLADENERAMGFLTQTRQGVACLITRQQQNVPMPPKKEEE